MSFLLCGLAIIICLHTSSVVFFYCAMLPKDYKIKHLRYLRLYGCECLRWVPGISLPTSLGSLDVRMCERLEFPIPTERMQHYTSLQYIDVSYAGSHFVSFPLGLFPNLQVLRFENCKDLEKVYIPEGIDDNILGSLSFLNIRECRDLEIIGKEKGRGRAIVLPALNLRELSISLCEKVKPVLIEMEGKVLLPKLTHLRIEKLQRTTPELALNLRRRLLRFSCMRELAIKGEEVVCFPDPDKYWGSLPTYLMKLHIYDSRKLRRVDGKALQTLTSLEELYIRECPKLERLPEEWLPPSLGRLDMRGCPMVEERCQPEKGLDWSKIHHIPWVMINDRCITGP